MSYGKRLLLRTSIRNGLGVYGIMQTWSTSVIPPIQGCPKVRARRIYVPVAKNTLSPRKVSMRGRITISFRTQFSSRGLPPPYPPRHSHLRGDLSVIDSHGVRLLAGTILHHHYRCAKRVRPWNKRNRPPPTKTSGYTRRLLEHKRVPYTASFRHPEGILPAQSNSGNVARNSRQRAPDEMFRRGILADSLRLIICRQRGVVLTQHFRQQHATENM